VCLHPVFTWYHQPGMVSSTWHGIINLAWYHQPGIITATGAQPQGNKSKGFGPPRPSMPSGGDEQGEEGDQTSVEAPTTTSIFESCLVGEEGLTVE
jgi:hypothetical protein